ncbi:hypothetical protein D3C84_1102750 [compost metagenome]
MADDPVYQVRSNVVAFAHPDAQIVLFVFEQEGAPMPVVQVDYIAEARGNRWRTEGR